VLWTLAEDLRALMAVQSGTESGRPVDALLREQRVWGARQGAVQGALGRYSRAELETALAHAAHADRAIKCVALGEPWDELARLGLELMHGTRRAA
jgi:DNA polymerase-3 subunit delta